MSEFKETTIEMAIERLRNLHKSFPTNNKENRAMKGAYVHSVEILKEFLPEEKKQIIDAYLAGTIQFDNAAPIVRPKTPDTYYSETFGDVF